MARRYFGPFEIALLLYFVFSGVGLVVNGDFRDEPGEVKTAAASAVLATTVLAFFFRRGHLWPRWVLLILLVSGGIMQVRVLDGSSLLAAGYVIALIILLRSWSRLRPTPYAGIANLPCGYNIPVSGHRVRTSFPLALVSILNGDVRIQGRSLFGWFGSGQVLPLNEVDAAQPIRGRLNRGVAILVKQGSPWYIYLFRTDELLAALRSAGVEILAGSRTVSLWDEL